MKKLLVVYYSWSNGNTRKIAEELANKTGADLAAIETVVPYKGSYDEVVSQGQREVEQGVKPKIKDLGVSLQDYDVVAVGTPTWWYTMAPAVHTFLADNDWKGRTVIPFMTNAGWPGHVIRDMEKACPGASFPVSMQIRFDQGGGDTQVTPQKEVDGWIAKVQQLLG
ncbi:MAG: flavodoxin [Aristaeellaceae bacterium]